MKKKLVAVLLMIMVLSTSAVLAVNMANQGENTVLEAAYSAQDDAVMEEVYGTGENNPFGETEALPNQEETVMESIYSSQGNLSIEQPMLLPNQNGLLSTGDDSLVRVEGTWSNQNGLISVSQANNDAKAYIKDSNYVNLQFSADVMMGNGSSTSDAGIFFRASNVASGTNALKGYYVGIDAVGDRLLLGRLNNSWTGLNYTPMTINTNQYYRLTVVAVDNNIKVYVNGVLKINVTDTSPILTGGHIGFRASKTAATFRQIECENVNILSTVSGVWSTAYNPVVYSTTQGQDNKVQFSGYNYSDLEFSAQVKVGRDNAASDAGLIFRASNVAAGTNAMKGYYAGIDANKQRIILGKLNNGWTTLGEVYMDISANQNYKVTVKAVGSNIKVYVNDTLKIDATDKHNSYSSGGIGFRASQTAAWYTQVEHKSITSSEQGSTLSVTSGCWSTNYSPALSYFSAHWTDSKATLNGGSSYGDVEISAQVRSIREDDTADAGLIFRAADLGTGSNELKGYYVGIDSYRDILLLGKLNNNWTGLSSVSMDIAADQYYKLTVKAVDNHIEVYVNDVLKIDYTDNSDPYLSGAVGFRANNTTADFKQVEFEERFSVSVSGSAVVGDVLTAHISPAGATAGYQWQYSTDGTQWNDISGATASNYTIHPDQLGRYLRVTATGTGEHSGSVVSSAPTAVVVSASYNENAVKQLTKDARTTIGNLSGGAQNSYELPAGVTVSSKSDWSANSGLTDANGDLKTLYTGSSGKWIKYNPNQSGSILDYGTYDIYFWFPYHEQNAGVNLNAEIYSRGKTKQIPCSALAENAGSGADSRWVKIGSFDFTGANDEYLKLTSTGFARIANVKFVKTGVRMDVRSTSGNLSGQPHDYVLGAGVTISDQNAWSANSQLTDSEGELRTIYTTGETASTVQFSPNQVGNGLQEGNYDVFIWNVYDGDNTGINMSADVLADGYTTHFSQELLDEKTGSMTQSKWVKIGTFYFNGTSNEYLKLTSTGYARIGDVKFIKAGQSGQSGEEEIDVPILLRETTPVLVTIGFQNRTTLADVVFCVSYNESNCTLTDFCALTEEKEQSTGLIQGGNVEILSHTFNAMTNRKELRFKSAKTIPPGKMMSGVANIVKFQGTAGAQINESIKISVETEGAGA